MRTLEATYRIVTPMFCSGGDPENKAELRLASFKGALRFWWRSLMWGQVKDVAELRKQEAELFGASDQKVGQSKIRLRLVDQELARQVNAGDEFEHGRLKGAHYLAYGVMHAFASKKNNTKAGQLTRPMIPAGTFAVGLHFAPSLNDAQTDGVRCALVLLGTVGGLGSKSRKGFGSLTLTNLKRDGAPVELAATPGDRIHSAVDSLTGGQPEWTAWSDRSRVLTVNGTSRRAVELLDLLGREQVYFRSWGRRDERRGDTEHKVLGKNSEHNFPEDHDLSKPALRGKVAIQHPQRIAFGLPHNYQTGGVKPSTLDRRASPLFLHVHQASETVRPVGVAAFLPSLFLPEGEQIRAFNKTVSLDTSDGFWNPVHAYLDRLLGKPDATKKQTDLTAQEVKLG